MISTRGRYALRVMTDLAEHESEGNIPLKTVSERQDISQKYLESIAVLLSKAHLVESAHGKGGGYRLNRKPHEYSVGEILRVTEGNLAPVACLCGDEPCEKSGKCKTFPMWSRLDRMITDFFDGITLADLMNDSLKVSAESGVSEK